MIENLKEALRLRPNYGRYIYNVAAGYALSGNQSEAIAWLARLADMGLVYQPAASADFAAKGSSLSATESAASMPSVASAAHSSREGRQSMRQFDDAIDNGLQLRVLGPFLADEPLPQLIVLAIQQA
jgi:hypothetical protein